jgi:hypothetical protein
MNLTSTSDIVRIVTTSTANLDVQASWVDQTTTAFTPGRTNTTISTATTTTVVSSPAASTQRAVTSMKIFNRHASTAQGVTVEHFDGSTSCRVWSGTLAAGEHVEYDGKRFIKFDASGREEEAATMSAGYTGRVMALLKVGTASEAVGVGYCSSKDTGFPGAWAVGTPGLAGRATDGTTAADNGCIPWQNAGTGEWYLTQFNMSSSVAHFHHLMDVMWVNSGIVVTTTTAQTINSVAFPARDVNGSTNGEGVMVGILVTTATTNAGAITNTTMSYTNSDGTAGRTATMASFPATAVVGTIVWFQLAAGDKGVRSIQTITLGTSYGGGAISLVAARWIAQVPMTVVNLGASAFGTNAQNPGVRLYDGSCLLHWYVSSATTATNIQGMITLMER